MHQFKLITCIKDQFPHIQTPASPPWTSPKSCLQKPGAKTVDLHRTKMDEQHDNQ